MSKYFYHHFSQALLLSLLVYGTTRIALIECLRKYVAPGSNLIVQSDLTASRI